MQRWGGSLVDSLTPPSAVEMSALQGLIKTCLPLTPPQPCKTERFIFPARVSFINTYLPLWFVGFSDTHLLVFEARVSFLNTCASTRRNYRASLILTITLILRSALPLRGHRMTFLYSKHSSAYTEV